MTATVDIEWRHPAKGKRPASTWQWWAQNVPVATVVRWFGADSTTDLIAGHVIARPLIDAPAEWRIA